MWFLAVVSQSHHIPPMISRSGVKDPLRRHRCGHMGGGGHLTSLQWGRRWLEFNIKGDSQTAVRKRRERLCCCYCRYGYKGMKKEAFKKLRCETLITGVECPLSCQLFCLSDKKKKQKTRHSWPRRHFARGVPASSKSFARSTRQQETFKVPAGAHHGASSSRSHLSWVQMVNNWPDSGRSEITGIPFYWPRSVSTALRWGLICCWLGSAWFWHEGPDFD